VISVRFRVCLIIFASALISVSVAFAYIVKIFHSMYPSSYLGSSNVQFPIKNSILFSFMAVNMADELNSISSAGSILSYACYYISYAYLIQCWF
jgi:hypothetical protein